MKKLSIIILALILTAVLFGCGKKEEVTDTTLTSTTVTETKPQNKGESVEKAEFNSVVGEEISIPEKADNENFYVIQQESEEFGQATFRINNVDYVLRIVESNEFKDISGLFFKWNKTKDCEVNGNKAEIHLYKTEDDSCSVIIWFDSDSNKMYSLSTDSVVKEEVLINLATDI